MVKLFVYGTLMKGNAINAYMAPFKYLGKGILNGFDMYTNGAFPMIIKGVGSVKGEVYEVGSEIVQLGILDQIESAYTRSDIKVIFEDNLLDCQTYIYNGGTEFLVKIEDGDWNNKDYGKFPW